MGKQTASALPGMLPRGAGITSAPDATEALIRAVSYFWAIEAARFAEEPGEEVLSVAGFRSSVLGGSLLAADKIAPWIHEQEERDGKPSWWLEGVTLDEGDYEEAEEGTIRITKAIPIDWKSAGEPGTAWERPGVSRREVLYITPELPVDGRPVRAGGVLDDLRRLSLLLAEAYAWEPEQATAFILTGLTPYNTAWARQIKTMRVKGRRPRDLSIKHLALACFWEEHKGESMATRMTLWNALYQKWEYTTVTNFGRDGRQAVARLSERMGERISAEEPEPGPDLEAIVYAFEQDYGSGKPKSAKWGADIVRDAEEARRDGRLPPRKRPARRRTTPTDLEKARDAASEKLTQDLIAVSHRLAATKDETEIQQGIAEGMRLAEAIQRLLPSESAEATV
ncbi:MAG TPA: hypothetical protein VH349_18245 [Ktedonobacterales bacterium]